MGLYPEPFIAAAKSAAAGLLEPSRYVDAVFPGSGAMKNWLGIVLLTLAWLALDRLVHASANALLGLALSALALVLRARAATAQRVSPSGRCASPGWPSLFLYELRAFRLCASPGWC